MRQRFLVALAVVAVPQLAWGHGGGTNAQGCHTNRKTGDYHCHGAGRSSAPARVYGLVSARSRSGAFVNCTAARAAGAAPVRRDEPGYGAHLDRDGDGVGCE